VASLVALDLPGGPAFVEALRRAWDGGDAVLPVDQRLPTPAKQQLLEAMAPSRVVSHAGTAARAGGRPVQPGDALVVATSGTTGTPRGVVLTHAAVRASAVATSNRLQVDPSAHRWLACLPLSHVGGLSVVTRALVTGTPLEVLPGFDAAEVTESAGPEVLVSLVATALRRVDAGAFHTVVLGGSAPPAGLPANVATTYGMTETGSGVVYDGIALDGVEVAIGARGEVRLRGPMLLRAYRESDRDEGGTTPLDAEGWFATGDAGTVGPDGRLHIDGRLSDLIISGGENIWPAPVEAVLREHPAISDVAVAGRPDPEWGERVVAWVVPADPAAPPTLEDLRRQVKEQLAPCAAPRQLVLLTELPRTEIGKVQKNALRSDRSD
jgi:O-succinylbenzoic acid--CoA ligase